MESSALVVVDDAGSAAGAVCQWVGIAWKKARDTDEKHTAAEQREWDRVANNAGYSEKIVRVSSWGDLALRTYHFDDDQLPDVTMGTGVRRRNDGESLGRWRDRSQLGRGGGLRCVEQSAGLIELFATGTAPDSVIAHLGATPR